MFSRTPQGGVGRGGRGGEEEGDKEGEEGKRLVKGGIEKRRIGLCAII